MSDKAPAIRNTGRGRFYPRTVWTLKQLDWMPWKTETYRKTRTGLPFAVDAWGLFDYIGLSLDYGFVGVQVVGADDRTTALRLMRQHKEAATEKPDRAVALARWRKLGGTALFMVWSKSRPSDPPNPHFPFWWQHEFFDMHTMKPWIPA